jgi:hypothetical protein
MRAREARKVTTLRLILAAIKDRDIAARTEDKSEADDDVVIQQILVKMIKQRRDSIVAYDDAGRAELAEQEREEICIIEKFLPEQMSDEEIAAACAETVSETGAEGLKDIGRIMGALKAKYAGQMDFSKASARVREILS